MMIKNKKEKTRVKTFISAIVTPGHGSITPAGVLFARPLPTLDLVVVAAPLLCWFVQPVVGTQDGGEAARGAVEVPGALPHVREQEGLLLVLRAQLLHHFVVVDAGTALGI